MGGAVDRWVLGRACPALCPRHSVVELDEVVRSADVTVVAREGAAAAVADEDLVSYDDGHGPPLAACLRRGGCRPGARRLGAKAPPFLGFDELLEGALQQDGVVPTRVGVSEERAGAGESAIEGGVDAGSLATLEPEGLAHRPQRVSFDLT